MASHEADSNLGLSTLLLSALSLLLLTQLLGSPTEFMGILLLLTAGFSATGWYLLSSIDYLRRHRAAHRLWLLFCLLYICLSGLALCFIADASRAG